jgi:hypothetical protein
MSRIAWKGVMGLPQQHVSEGVLPNLRETSLEQLEQLADNSVLAHAIDLYRQRLRENGVSINKFNNLSP